MVAGRTGDPGLADRKAVAHVERMRPGTAVVVGGHGDQVGEAGVADRGGQHELQAVAVAVGP